MTLSGSNIGSYCLAAMLAAASVSASAAASSPEGRLALAANAQKVPADQASTCVRVVGGTLGEALERRQKIEACPLICQTEVDGKTLYRESDRACDMLAGHSSSKGGRISLWVPLAALGLGGGAAAAFGGGKSDPSSP